MKTLLLLTAVITTFNFTSAQDLTKKEAKEIFLKSEITNNPQIIAMQQIKKSDFNTIFNNAKCIKKYHKIDFKDMPVFKEKADKILFHRFEKYYLYFPENQTANGSADDKIEKPCTL